MSIILGDVESDILCQMPGCRWANERKDLQPRNGILGKLIAKGFEPMIVNQICDACDRLKFSSVAEAPGSGIDTCALMPTYLGRRLPIAEAQRDVIKDISDDGFTEARTENYPGGF